MKEHNLWYIVSHLSIVLSVAFLVLFFIDRVNPMMGFLGSDQSDWLLFLFCLSSLLNGVFSSLCLLRRKKVKYKREHPSHAPHPGGGDSSGTHRSV